MVNKALWLARLLYRRGALTKREILDAWRDEDDRARPMAESTFYDNRRALESRYGLRLACSGGRYALCGAEENGALRRLLGAEGQPLDARADEETAAWLPLLADAVTSRHQLRMDYVPLDKAAYTTLFHPYALTLIRGFYYTVGLSERHGEVRNFAVDRIAGLTLLPMRFRRPADFSTAAYFAHSFGAYGGNDVCPRHVVLAAGGPHAAAYLRQRPLHPSQHEMPAPEGEARFELDVALTRDFVGQLLSFGADIRVVSPDDLRRLMGDVARTLARDYCGPDGGQYK